MQKGSSLWELFSGLGAGSKASGSQSKLIKQREASWKATGIVAIRDAKLKSLPTAIGGLGPAVRILDAGGNEIEELPPWVGALTGLQRLVLSENRLSSIAVSLQHLSSLKTLLLDANQLTGLPPQIGLLSRLEKLSVARNKLRTLPDSIGKLKKLSQLDIRSNQLSFLPASIGECEALEELHAQENLLGKLPPSVIRLKALKSLNLDANKLSELPDQLFRGCSNLRSLSLQGNLITVEALEKMDGYGEYEARRQNKVNKQIAGNVMIDSSALSEAITR